MNKLENAEHYYKIVGGSNKGGTTFHNGKGRLNIGFESTWIYFDGMFGCTENTKTLEALEKRGLIKIHHIGGDASDVIEVIGKTPHEPLTKAVELKVIRKWNDRDWTPQELTEYMDPATTTVEEIERRYNESHSAVEYTVTAIREVELTRWDYRK